MAQKKKKKSNVLRNLAILVGVLVLGLILARSLGWIGKEKVAEVQIASVQKNDILEQVAASGKIQPETEVKISSEVSGEIIDLNVKEGDSVIMGQLLVRIRPDILQNQVQSAEASLNSVRANYSQSQATLLQRQAEAARLEIEFLRSKKLFEQKVISDTEYLSAKTNFEVAQQQVKATERSIESAKFNVQSSQSNLNQSMSNLARTEIYAPASGTVSKLSIEKGEKVVGTAQMAGTEMLIIANLNNMEVQVDVNENDIVKVKLGHKVRIEVDSYLHLNRKFEGIVTEIANTANATTSADAVTEFKVKIRILNESYKDLIDLKSRLSPFRPGMTASVEVLTNRKEKVLSVPLAAVTTRKEEAQEKAKENEDANKDSKPKKEETADEIVFVFDPKTQKVSQRKVKTGISDFTNIEIIEGLKEGEQVVTGPFVLVSKQLKDGQIVKKMEEKDKKTNK
jgi:HlyD family secretion protein